MSKKNATPEKELSPMEEVETTNEVVEADEAPDGKTNLVNSLVIREFDEMTKTSLDEIDAIEEDPTQMGEDEEEGEIELTFEDALQLVHKLQTELEALTTKKEKTSKKELTTDEQVIVDTHFTPSEAAAELKVSDRALRKAIRGGSIEAIKVQSRWYISSEEVNRVRAIIEAGKKAEAEEAETEAAVKAELAAAEANLKAAEGHEALVEAIKEIKS